MKYILPSLFLLVMLTVAYVFFRLAPGTFEFVRQLITTLLFLAVWLGGSVYGVTWIFRAAEAFERPKK
jgi:hypothetical protein